MQFFLFLFSEDEYFTLSSSSSSKPFKLTILGGSLSFEVVGAWKRFMRAKEISPSEDFCMTYTEVFQDVISRFWSNLGYHRRLPCKSFTGRLTSKSSG
ncbi:hypothetical protein IGI04_015881 [Brassica rapa subsp. trilocularis]|uniref:Uncharacterized protein n=1 Tax=Brassica rapa subsp. trilocularis TaxID=1813537 RepID=A0ABQ7MRE1_BRACM|nr:hypothetical protein IGI04_015881 [Brassica rapa subsp. trilocularis]